MRWALCLALLAGCAGLDASEKCPAVANPTGDCETPDDGSRAGTHSAERCTWLRHCQVKRELWRAFATEPGGETWFLFPRPDGSMCVPEAKRAMPEINALTQEEALLAVFCLHKTLTFTAEDHGTDNWDVRPSPFPSDIAEICGNQAPPALAQVCQRCPVAAILNGDGDVACPAIYQFYTRAEAEALAPALNALYQ